MKIKMLVELDYDAGIMHGDDHDSVQWFMNEVLMADRGDLSLHSNEIGDTIGSVKVLSIDTKPEDARGSS